MDVETTEVVLRDVSSWEEFTEALRDLHAACGSPTYESLATHGGLAKSAISNLIGRNHLRRPTDAITLRFVTACLTYAHREPEEIKRITARWHQTWRRLAADDKGENGNGHGNGNGAAAAGRADQAAAQEPRPPAMAAADRPASVAAPAVPKPREREPEPLPKAATPSRDAEPAPAPPASEESATAAPVPAAAASGGAPPDQSVPEPRSSHSPQYLTALLVVMMALVAIVAMWLVARGDREPSASPAASTAASTAGSPTCATDPQAPTDNRMGRDWEGVFLCSNNPEALVYQWAQFGGDPVARLTTSRSWFVCWTRGQVLGGTDVWYYTRGGELLSQPYLEGWGFVSASDVLTQVHPDPMVTRKCSFSTGPGPTSAPAVPSATPPASTPAPATQPPAAQPRPSSQPARP